MSDNYSDYMLGAGLGGFAGRLLSSSELANRALTRLATGHNSPYRVLIDTHIAPGLYNGSGESKMSAQILKLLKKHGIGATFAPDLDRGGRYFLDSTYRDILRGSGVEQLKQLKRSGIWSTRNFNTPQPGELETLIAGGKIDPTTSVKGLNDILSGDKALLKKFKRDVLAGKYTGMSPGILRDIALVDKSLFNDPRNIGSDPSLIREALGRPREGGKSLRVKNRIGFNGFRGFTSNSWNPSDYFTHADNLYNTHLPYNRHAINLGTRAGFEANYKPETTRWFIPGTNVFRSKDNLNPVTAIAAHNRDRSFVENLIQSIRSDASKNTLGSSLGAADLNGKKIIFMQSGSVGPNNSQKFKDLIQSLTDPTTGKVRDDVHILFQHGNDTFSKDIRKVIADTNTRHPGLVTPIQRLDGSLMNRISNGSDLLIGYGGSSSAGELGSHLTPTIFTTDGTLNKGNIDYVRSLRKGKGIGTGLFDNNTTAWGSILSDFKNKYGRYPTDAELKGIAGTNGIISFAEKYRRLDNPNSFEILKSIMRDPSTVDRAVAANRAEVLRMLSDDVQKGRFSKDTIDSVRDYIAHVDASDKNMINSSRQSILEAINKDDIRRVNRFKRSLKQMLGLRNVTSKATPEAHIGRKLMPLTKEHVSRSALKRLMSSPGRTAKDAYLTLGSILAKTPAGRRFALPLMLTGGIASSLGLKKLLPRTKD